MESVLEFIVDLRLRTDRDFRHLASEVERLRPGHHCGLSCDASTALASNALQDRSHDRFTCASSAVDRSHDRYICASSPAALVMTPPSSSTGPVTLATPPSTGSVPTSRLSASTPALIANATRGTSKSSTASAGVPPQAGSPKALDVQAQILERVHSKVVGRAEISETIHGAEEGARRVASAILGHPAFDYAIAVIIFMNSISIGIETELSLHDSEPFWLLVIENVSLAIYVVEIAMRLFVRGWCGCFSDGWFIFDFTLVATGSLTTWFLRGSALPSLLQQVLVLRVLRLFRLVRALRGMRGMRTIWRLMYGLLTSGSTMVSTFLLLSLTIYIFGILGVELITKDPALTANPATSEIVHMHFRSLPIAMLTLLQFVNVDSCGAIYAPLITAKPELLVYFMSLLLIVSISVMNLVTAVLVEGALAQASGDKEMQRNALAKQLASSGKQLLEVFTALDRDNNGELHRDEVRCASIDMLPVQVRERIANLDMEELFDLLDEDGSGVLTPDEFVGGLFTFLVSSEPVSQIHLQKSVQAIKKTLSNVEVLCLENREEPREEGTSTHDSSSPRLAAATTPEGAADLVLQGTQHL
eukprot:TRINITY_DN21848_c0_g1_i2.p1 TRINITY_DN21848_c0_g1~~TRINITY_DN21848_c0_g1_i2.p1  ORF type:complete len:655 (+),score=151.88 TRINITY_DN21848_c0_g1_i2:203-1966(+)